MNLLDPQGRPIPRKPKPFNPPPENKNFKADFNIEVAKRVVNGAPYKMVVMGSMAPDASSVMVAVELKFRNGVVISGGPLHMEIKQDEENINNSGPDGAPGGSGSDPDSGV